MVHCGSINRHGIGIYVQPVHIPLWGNAELNDAVLANDRILYLVNPRQGNVLFGSICNIAQLGALFAKKGFRLRFSFVTSHKLGVPSNQLLAVSHPHLGIVIGIVAVYQPNAFWPYSLTLV